MYTTKLIAALLLFSGALLACAPTGATLPNATAIPATTALQPAATTAATEQPTTPATVVPPATVPATIEATTAPTIAPSTPMTVTEEATAVATEPAMAGMTDCGSIHTLGPQPPDASAKQAEDCFWQAYQSCIPATLSVTVAGVDAGVSNQFELAKNGAQCKITVASVHFVIPRPTPEPQVSTCAGLIQQNGGLVAQGCGDQGDIVIPAPQP